MLRTKVILHLHVLRSRGAIVSCGGTLPPRSLKVQWIQTCKLSSATNTQQAGTTPLPSTTTSQVPLANSAESSPPAHPPDATHRADAHIKHTTVADGLRQAELALMAAVYMNDLKRFRMILAGVLSSAAVLGFIFWPQIKALFVSNTSEFASAVLQAKDVQDQASVFAKAVVNEILNDPAVRAQAFDFVESIVLSEAVKNMAVEVIRVTLQDEATQQHVRRLTDEIVAWLLADPGVRKELQSLLWWLMLQPETQASVVDLTNRSLADPALQSQGSAAVSMALQRALDDPALRRGALVWLQGVLADDALREQGGDYLWSAYKYSITPRFSFGTRSSSVPSAASDAHQLVDGATEGAVPSATPHELLATAAVKIAAATATGGGVVREVDASHAVSNPPIAAPTASSPPHPTDRIAEAAGAAPVSSLPTLVHAVAPSPIAATVALAEPALEPPKLQVAGAGVPNDYMDIMTGYTVALPHHPADPMAQVAGITVATPGIMFASTTSI